MARIVDNEDHAPQILMQNDTRDQDETEGHSVRLPSAAQQRCTQWTRRLSAAIAAVLLLLLISTLAMVSKNQKMLERLTEQQLGGDAEQPARVDSNQTASNPSTSVPTTSAPTTPVDPTQLLHFWEESGSMFVGEYHDDCAAASGLAEMLHRFRPLPSALFVEFFTREPPTDWADLIVMYNEETRGYPCANYHAVLVQEARRLGIEVVGLANENFTISKLGVMSYLRYRSGGPYDEYMWQCVTSTLQHTQHKYLHFTGSNHFSNQKLLWDRCTNSSNPKQFVGIQLNTTKMRCAAVDGNCSLIGDRRYYPLPYAPTCSDTPHTTSRRRALGSWAVGCSSQTCF